MTEGASLPRRSALTGLHHQLGAGMMEWNGMLVPSSYSDDILSEYQAIRQKAGLTDMSGIRKIRVSGPDAGAFMDYCITRNTQAIPPGGAAYTALLNDAGRLIDDAIAFRLDAPSSRLYAAGWLICTGGGSGLDMLMQTARDPGHHFDVNLHVDDDLHCLMIQGPAAAGVITSLFGDDTPASYRKFGHGLARLADTSVLVARTSYSGEDGFEIFAYPDTAQTIWNTLLRQHADTVSPAGFTALNIARIEAGLLFFGQDMTGQETPAELGLDFIVDAEKTDFRGRKNYLACHKSPRIMTMGVVLEDGPGFTAGDRLTANGTRADAEQAGIIRSAVHSPWLDKTIGIAHISTAYAVTGSNLDVVPAGTASHSSGARVQVTSRRFIRQPVLPL